MPRSLFCPEFQLELPDRKNDRINWRMLHTKRTFKLPVKIEDWEQLRDTVPFDNEPTCPGAVNLFKSHYNRFGFEEPEPFMTETMRMLNQRYEPDKYSCQRMKKHMMSYMSYKDLLPCGVENEHCAKNCYNDYISTMQYSYTPPYPYVMERLSTPAIPFLKYRRFKFENPDLSDHTFYDEGFPEKTALLQQHKVDRYKSYNFCTDLFSDGTPVPQKKKRCYPLEYRKN